MNTDNGEFQRLRPSLRIMKKSQGTQIGGTKRSGPDFITETGSYPTLSSTMNGERNFSRLHCYFRCQHDAVPHDAVPT